VLDFPHGHQKENQKSSQEEAGESHEEIAEKNSEEIRREKKRGEESCRAEEASLGEAGGNG